MIRPECVEVQEPGLTGANRLPGMVDSAVFLGSTTQLMIRLPHGAVLQSLVTNSARRDSLATGQPVTVHLPSQSLRVLASVDESPAAPADQGMAVVGGLSAVVGEVLERRPRAPSSRAQTEVREDQGEERSREQQRGQSVQRRRRG